MPLEKHHPEDSFNFDDWATDSRPPLEAVTVSTHKGYLTLVLKSPSTDDDEAAEKLVAEYKDCDADECMIAQCIVARKPGRHSADDLKLTEMVGPFPPVLNPDQVRKMHKAIYRRGWLDITTAFQLVAMRRPEPDYPSSPES